jgi:hypothetical protein
MLDATSHFPTRAMEGYQNGDKEDLNEDDEDARLYQHQFKERNTMAFDDEKRCKKNLHAEASWCPYGLAACFHLMVHRVTVAEEAGAAVKVTSPNGEMYGSAASSFCGAPGNKKLACFFDWLNHCRCDRTFCGSVSM